MSANLVTPLQNAHRKRERSPLDVLVGKLRQAQNDRFKCGIALNNAMFGDNIGDVPTTASAFGKAYFHCEHLHACCKELENATLENRIAQLAEYAPPQPGTRFNYVYKRQTFEFVIR